MESATPQKTPEIFPASRKNSHPAKKKKPAKPYPEFPLYAHSCGQWAKKIQYKIRYFGPWAAPNGSLKNFIEERDHLYAGVKPPTDPDGVTLDELVNRWLVFQRSKRDAGEIGQRHYDECIREGDRMLEILGRTRPVATLRVEDFVTLRARAVEKYNATTATNIITRWRSVFKWGHDVGGIIDHVRYGGALALPSAKLRRRALRERGPMDVSAADVHALLSVATARKDLAMYAMILLGVNCGLGNTDCSELRDGHLDLKSGVMEDRRSKTDVQRRAVLWPETVKALRKHLKGLKRSVDGDMGTRIFSSDMGLQLVHHADGPKSAKVDTVAVEFGKLARAAGVHRDGIGFYALRRVFRTVADETKDFPAIDLAMGHTANNRAGAAFRAGADINAEMGGRYRQRISDERLWVVAAHVRTWLFGDSAAVWGNPFSKNIEKNKEKEEKITKKT